MSLVMNHHHVIALRRKFTDQEDTQLRDLVERFGSENWEHIARFIPTRTARQCRDRYNNYLLNSLITTPWTSAEDAILIEQYHQIGPKWSDIAKLLNGRSGNHIKNRWRRHLSRCNCEKSSMEPTEQVNSSLSRNSTDFAHQSLDYEKKLSSMTPTILLCPELRLSQCDWSRMFDRMDDTLGYGSAWRNAK
jgi:hypothetical protein